MLISMGRLPVESSEDEVLSCGESEMTKVGGESAKMAAAFASV